MPYDGDPSSSSKSAAAGTRRFLATVSSIYCVSYIFLKDLLQAKTQQALPSGSRFLGTAAQLWFCCPLCLCQIPGKWGLFLYCRVESDMWDSIAKKQLTIGAAAVTISLSHSLTSPDPARMPSSPPFTPLPRIGLDQPQLLTLRFDCRLVLSGSLELTLQLIHRQFGYLSILTSIPAFWTHLYQV